jgi:glyoxylase-like metal-dependent hydrolase (beta-lactamase superfamily II)
MCDGELFEGVRTVHTGGHTPGHQMIYLDTPHGRAIITGDAAYVAELNVAGGVPSGYWVDLADSRARPSASGRWRVRRPGPTLALLR